jgi:hypothetical protein
LIFLSGDETRTGLELLMSLTFSLLVSPFGMEKKKKRIKQSTDGLCYRTNRDFLNKFPITPLQFLKNYESKFHRENSEMRADPLKYKWNMGERQLAFT